MEHDINPVFTGGGNKGLQVVSNSGTLYYLASTPAAEKTIEPPTPCTNIHFKRDPHFVARGSILDQIHEKCAVPSSRIALVGLGGVGKSQLVIEYGYRVREQYPDRWVFWIFAGSPARFEQDFRKIADLVEISGRDNPQVDILTLVHNWLRNVRNGKWLVIIDNADDVQIFFKSEVASQESQDSGQRGRFSQPLSWFLPQTDNGRILMTTRYRDVAVKFVEKRDIIDVEPMDESDALALLDKKTEGLIDRDSDGNRKKLVAALEYMPLAIAQAAAYIFRRNLNCPIQNYLARFRKSDREKIKLLEREDDPHRRDWDAKHSILITWQISFDHLRHIRQSAADRLSLMSLFDRQGIPKDLIREQTYAKETHPSVEVCEMDTQANSPSDSVSESSEDDEFEEDMVTLRDYSFVTFRGGESYEMHALVQLATRRWLAEEDRLDGLRRQFFKILARAFPADIENDANVKQCQLLFPHAKAALSQRPEAALSSNESQPLKDFALVMHSAGKYAWYHPSNLSDGEGLFKTAMEVRNKILDMEGMDTKDNKMDAMLSMTLLARIYCDQGQWSKAERLGSEALAKSQSEFGLKHWRTLRVLQTLTDIYAKQGNLDKAEKISLQALDTMGEVDDPSFVGWAPTLACLASVFRKQSKFEKAFALQEQVVRAAKEVLGPADLRTLEYMSGMVLMLRGLRRIDEAIEMQTQIVEKTESISGSQHFITLFRRYQLYDLFIEKGLVEKGLENMMQLLPAVTKVLGQNFPLAVAIMINISSAWMSLGNLDEAERMAAEALEICGRAFSSDGDLNSAAMESLVRILSNQGKKTKAKEVVLQLLDKRERLLGPGHPDTVKAINLLASIQKDLDSCEQAEDLEQ